MTESQHFLSSHRIIIVGAGISGLAFAISLHKLWPSISNLPPPRLTLYDRDPCAVPPGREGYSLSLRSDPPSGGIQTLQKMGMLDKLLDVCVSAYGNNEEENSEEEQGGFAVWDRDWTQLFKVRSKTPPGLPAAGMRISRAALRRTLVEAVEQLPGVEIHWGISIMGLSQSSQSSSPHPEISLHLSTGQSEPCTLLIAADGSSSKLRSLLRPNDTLQFAGAIFICGTAPLSTGPSSADNEFGMILSGTGVCLFVAPVDKTSLVWALSWKDAAPHTSKKQPLSAAECAALLDEARQKAEPAFGKRVLEMLENTDSKSLMKFSAMHKHAFRHDGAGKYLANSTIALPTSPHPNILFLGDANHAISPFGGNGANLALMDGWDLAEQVCRSQGLGDAVKRYDGCVVKRAGKVLWMSRFVIMVAHSGGWVLWWWLWVVRGMRWLGGYVVRGGKKR